VHAAHVLRCGRIRFIWRRQGRAGSDDGHGVSARGGLIAKRNARHTVRPDLRFVYCDVRDRTSRRPVTCTYPVHDPVRSIRYDPMQLRTRCTNVESRVSKRLRAAAPSVRSLRGSRLASHKALSRAHPLHRDRRETTFSASLRLCTYLRRVCVAHNWSHTHSVVLCARGLGLAVYTRACSHSLGTQRKGHDTAAYPCVCAACVAAWAFE
jgi:hypothetical protein